MDLLFILGIIWMLNRGWENGRPARNQRRIAAASRPGVNHARHKARARRQATAGWWATEISRGLPVTREGFRDGWREHREHLDKRQAASRERDHQHQGWRDSWAEHWRELTGGGEDESPGQNGHRPPLPEGKTGDPHMRGENCTDPACKCHTNDPPLADGKTPGNGTPQQKGKAMGDGPGGRDWGDGAPPPGGGGDANYDHVNETCDKAVQQAEQLAAMDIDACVQLPDLLGGTDARDNADLMGKAGELAASVRDLDTARKKVLDNAQAVKEQNTQDYGGQQEAADASGKPLSDYVTH